MELEEPNRLVSLCDLRSGHGRIVDLGYPPMTPAIVAFLAEIEKNLGRLPKVTLSDLFVLREGSLNTILSPRDVVELDREMAMGAISYIGDRVINELAKLPNRLSNRVRAQQGWVKKEHFSRRNGRNVWLSAPRTSGG